MPWIMLPNSTNTLIAPVRMVCILTQAVTRDITSDILCAIGSVTVEPIQGATVSSTSRSRCFERLVLPRSTTTSVPTKFSTVWKSVRLKPSTNLVRRLTPTSSSQFLERLLRNPLSSLTKPTVRNLVSRTLFSDLLPKNWSNTGVKRSNLPISWLGWIPTLTRRVTTLLSPTVSTWNFSSSRFPSVDDTTNWSTSSRVRAVWNPTESCFHT